MGASSGDLTSSHVTSVPVEKIPLEASSPILKNLRKDSSLCCILSPYRICAECSEPACMNCYTTNQEIKNCVTRDYHHPRFNTLEGTDPHARPAKDN
jgi:hypothetical protein